MIRAFVAFDVDAALVAAAGELGRTLREGACASLRASWVDPSRMHVTARFLGDADESVAGELGARLVALGEGRRPFDVRVTELSAFPGPRHARVIVLPLVDDGTCAALAAEVEAISVALGFAPETRSYAPHLTLARVRQPTDLRALVRDTPVALAGAITSLTLYRSELGPRGPTYTPLARAPFG